MHVLITGATGFVGRQLAAALIDNGHTFSCLTRNPARAQACLPGMVAAYAWEPGEVLDPGCLAGVDGVVHLAGESVTGRWNSEKRRRVRESRIKGTRTLVDAILAADKAPGVLVSASGIGFYGDRGDVVLTEDALAGEDFFAALCVEWEAQARRAETAGVRVALARLGIVVGAGGGAIAAMLTPFRMGMGGPLGSGRQWWSWIERNDAARALRFVLETGTLSGPINLVAPEPVQQRQFARQLGSALGRPAVLPAPGWALSLVLGDFATEVLSSKRVVPQQLLQAGFTFEIDALSSALQKTASSPQSGGVFLPLLATATLGAAPFVPEPHLVGKLRWLAGGGVGMGTVDVFDLLLHAAPVAWLLMACWGWLRRRMSRT